MAQRLNITDQEYWTLEGYLHNSTLTKFEMALSGRYFPDSVREAFKLGSLVDKIITEPEKLNQEDHNSKYIEQAKEMVKAYNHPLTQNLDIAEGQAIYSDVIFGFDFCFKYDLLLGRIGYDIKTTACTSEKSFISSLYALNYDRQRFIYTGDTEIFVFIGISKKKVKGKHQFFIFVSKKEDDFYISGMRKTYSILKNISNFRALL